MKLLIATDCFLPRWDGIARFLQEMIPNLTGQVTVIAPDFPGTYQHPKHVQIVRMPLSMLKVGDYRVPKSDAERIQKLVSEHEIIWAHTIGSIGAATIEEAWKQRKPIVSYVHSLEWELVTKSLSRWNPLRLFSYALALRRARHMYNKAKLILVPSQEIAELLENKGIHAPMRVVRLGVNTDLFSPGDKAHAKMNLEINPNTKVIGYVGRLSREKDITTLLHAFSLVYSRYQPTLLIVGDGLSEIKNKLNVPGIKYVGAQDNVIPYLQAMDIYVLPSLTETTSLSTLEAMSCGVAPLTTPVGLVKSYIVEKQNGLFFPMQNPFVLSLKLKWLLENGELMTTLQQNARKTVVEQFSWQNTVKECLEALREVDQQYAARVQSKDVE